MPGNGPINRKVMWTPFYDTAGNGISAAQHLPLCEEFLFLFFTSPAIDTLPVHEIRQF
jgi:hypothetical protein